MRSDGIIWPVQNPDQAIYSLCLNPGDKVRRNGSNAMRPSETTTSFKSTRKRSFQMMRKPIGFAMVFLLVVLGTVRAELIDRVAAMVNNDIILYSDVEQVLSVVAGTLDQQNYSPMQKKEILNEQSRRILDQLIYDKLTDQQVQRHQLKVEDGEVDATIERIRKVNKMSDEELRRALEMDGMSFEKYREQIKERMLRTRLVNREVKSKIVITDEDVRAYYDSHRSEYGGQTKYELRHILLKVTPSSGSEQKERALRQINDIHKRLTDGEAFETLAGQYSESSSAQQNGYLGIFDINVLSDQIKQAIDGLGAEQFSNVVDTDQGYQIFYVEAILQSGGRSLEDVRAEIQEKLYADVVDKKFNEWIKDLRQRSHVLIMESEAKTAPATSSP
jgi:peptidyl-prolyl cis-trans isomerase SurA